jgi:fatty acid kinase fatty acid binding subunit
VLDARAVPGVVVVTDSTACVRARRAAAGLRVVPVSLLFTDREASDDEIRPATVYRRLARGEAVKSQAPPPAAYLEAIETGDHDAALVLTPAHEFTVMAHNARLAAELATRPTVVVDTRTAAAGQGLVVRAALAAAGDGADLDEVGAVARDAAARVELLAAILDSSQLEHSGHVHRDAAAGRRKRPPAMVARFRGGQVVPLAATGDPLRALATAWRRGDGRADTTLVFHSAQRPRAERLRRLVAAGEPILTCSAAMGAHVGPGLVGVAWLTPPSAKPQVRVLRTESAG